MLTKKQRATLEQCLAILTRTEKSMIEARRKAERAKQRKELLEFIRTRCNPIRDLMEKGSCRILR